MTLNQCNFIGNLGADPEASAMPSGTVVSKLSVGVSEKWTDKTSGEKRERTEWVRVECYNRLAEICNQYLTKGQQVFISGQMRTDKWQDQDGKDRYTTKIIARQMQLLGGRDGGAAKGATTKGASPAASAPASQSPGGSASDFNDDIPF